MRFQRGEEMAERSKELVDGQKLSAIYSRPYYRGTERIGKRFNRTSNIDPHLR